MPKYALLGYGEVDGWVSYFPANWLKSGWLVASLRSSDCSILGILFRVKKCCTDDKAVWFDIGNPYGDEVVDRTAIRHNKKAVCDPLRS
jgi:hypothetical protein